MVVIRQQRLLHLIAQFAVLHQYVVAAHGVENFVPFARLQADVFFRYDQLRPWVDIQQGELKQLRPPGGTFYATRRSTAQRDVVVFKAHEPNLRWYDFVNMLLAMCAKLKIDTLITLGSMFDQVLHTDRIISGIASDPASARELQAHSVHLIDYQGPSAIHSLIHAQGVQQGVRCLSLWCHCPHYLQEATHFGLLAQLGTVLAALGTFELEVAGLENKWQALKAKIDALIDQNPEMQKIIANLRKAKVKGSWADKRASAHRDDKVIKLEDFLNPRTIE